MLKRFSVLVGFRYTGLRRHSRLVSFISKVSIAGLALGVALLVVVLSVMNGFDREMRQRILGLVPHISIYSYQPLDDWRAVAELTANNPMVEAAAPFVHLQGMWLNNGRVEAALIHAIDPVAEAGVSIIEQFLLGKQLSDLAQHPDGVLMSKQLAGRLAVQPGDKLTLIVPAASQSGHIAPRLKRLQLLGLFQTGTELDNALALINIEAGARLMNLGGHVEGVRLKVADLFAAPQVAYEVIQNLPPHFYARHWGHTHGNLFYAIQMSKKLVGILLFIIIAVAVFNVVSTLVMAVNEKQGDIAILRAMGASPSDILWIFVVQGSLIGVIGTAVGLVFGVVLAACAPDLVVLLEQWLDITFLKTDVYPVSYLPVDIRLTDCLLIAAVALGMSVLATIYPARRAAKVLPADVLRYE